MVLSDVPPERSKRASVAFSPDGLKVVSASLDNTMRVWCAATGDCEQTMEGHTSTVFSAAFSPDGLKVVSASRRHRYLDWDLGPLVLISSVATGECDQKMTGHIGTVFSAAFSLV
jgi:WD40 repeat protein